MTPWPSFPLPRGQWQAHFLLLFLPILWRGKEESRWPLLFSPSGGGIDIPMLLYHGISPKRLIILLSLPSLTPYSDLEIGRGYQTMTI